jgi:hypothetical protein
MTLSGLRFAYTSTISRTVVASAVLTIERTGVMPLPPAKATIGASVARNTNRPAGGIASIVSPGASVSFIQFDIFPPGTRFTVTVKGSPVSGELDIE